MAYDTRGTDLHPFKYNGKEFENKHGLDQYDYHARQYDAPSGRFTTVDPLAEKFYSWSPYNYCYNNPIKFIDPDGKGPNGPPASYWMEKRTPEQMQETGNTALKMTALDDLVVLGSALLSPITGKDPIHIDGSTATGEDVQNAKNYLLLPVSGKVVGSAEKAVGKVVDAVTDVGKVEKTITKSINKTESAAKSIAEQAKDLSHEIKKNSITITTPNTKYHFDLRGAEHKGVKTPHVQRSFPNTNPESGVTYWNKDSKWIRPMDQQDLRIVKEYLKRQ